MDKNAPIKYEIDRFSNITAKFRDGGMLATQSVEAHLMLAILRQLEKISEQLEPVL